MYEESSDPVDRAILLLLAGTLSIFPIGTIVQLSTGEVAEVVARKSNSLDGDGPLDRPVVRILTGASGAKARPITIDLAAQPAGQPARTIVRVMNTEGWGKGAPAKEENAGYGSDAPPSHASGIKGSTENGEEFPAPADSVPSMDSLGSTPSQVAGAMGRSMSPPAQSAGSMAPSRMAATAMPPAMRAAHQEPAIRAAAPQPPHQEEDARTMMVQSPFEDRDAPSSRHRPLLGALGANETPTAKGVLETTPLPHVLVYMLDHFLNGTVVLYPLGQAESVIYSENGVPAKARLGMAGFFLGEYLAEVGALRPDQVPDAVRGSKQSGTLMGEYLVRANVMTRATLEAALQRQLVQRVAYLANLPAATEYAFFGERDFLADGASGDLVRVGALNPILAAVRIWKDRARVRATLARIGQHQLVLHDEADVAALTLTPGEEAVLDAVVTRRPTVAELLQLNVTDLESASSLIYALAVTRQFAFPGQQKSPMAPRKRSMLPPSFLSGASGAAAASLDANGAASQAPRSMMPKGGPQVRPVLVPRRPTSAGMPAVTGAGPVSSSATSSSKFAAASSRVPNAPPSGASVASVSSSAIPSARGSSPGLGPASAASPGTSRSAAFSPQPPTVAPASSASSAASSRGSARSQTSIPPARGGSLPSDRAAPPSRPSRPSRPAPPSASGPQMTAPPVSPRSRANADTEAEADQAMTAMTDFRTAETQLQRGDLPGALAAAERAAAGDPTQTEYLALRAWVAALAKGGPQVNASIVDLDALIARDPQSERALLYRGKLYKRANRPEEALRDLERLLQINPKHREATGEVRLLKMHVKKA